VDLGSGLDLCLAYTMVILNAIACPFRDRPLSVISGELAGVEAVETEKIDVVIAGFPFASVQAVNENGVVVE